MTDPRSAAELARINKARQPNESPEYRLAREALLAEEIALRRQIARSPKSAVRYRRAAR